MTDPLPPFSDTRLQDPAYRGDLLAKLEALISVLEVAHAKVVSNLSRPVEDAARLRRVRDQVENTLKVCRQARQALQGGSPISMEEVLGTDIETLCEQLAGRLGG